jgi:S-adenosylmethionine synthetase
MLQARSGKRLAYDHLIMNVVLEQMLDAPPGARAFEIVERKGIGHPDTICDALAEEVSRALSRHYLERFGRVLHHNVDKALLCGGASAPRFGGGEVTEPIEIILAGRATTSFGGTAIPVDALAIEASRAWLRAHLHSLDPDRHVRITCRFRPGSADLVDLFGRGRAVLANDTSIGVGFAPLSSLEAAVLDVERWMNEGESKRQRPEAGEDVKVMGTRADGRTRLTVACAFVAAHLASTADYLEKKERLREAIQRRTGALLADDLDVVVNGADDAASGSIYLTVTGTSAEAGDDGEVGRGNRANGLITPGRPMTLEAAAGKNPVSHVGKLYNLAATRIAQDLLSALPDVTDAECALVSDIGSPIDAPALVAIRLRAIDGRRAADHADAAAEVARANLSRLPTLTEQFIAGTVGTY